MKYLLLACAVVFITSCADKQIVCNSSLDNYQVQFNVADATTFPVNEIFEIKGKLIGKKKIIDSATKMNIEAIMPDHHHGMNLVPKITMKKNGEFEVEGMMFHMPGKWLIQFYITNGTLTESASYEITI